MTEKQKDYQNQAREHWGNTAEYKEFAQKDKNRTDTQREELAVQMMEIFQKLGAYQELPPDSLKPQALVRELQEFITENYYHCTQEILASLGKLYGCGGELTQNINAAAGAGTAEYAARAIEAFCKDK